MMPGTRRVLASLAALAAGIAWLGHLGLGGEEEEEQNLPSAPRLALVVPASPNVPEVGPLQAISDRPLFSPDRRPWRPKPQSVQPPPAVPEPPPPHIEAALLGVVLSPTGNTAILRIDGGTSAVVTEGGMVGGWTLRRVSAGGVTLASAGVEQEVAFTSRHGSSAPAPVEASPAPPPPVRRKR